MSFSSLQKNVINQTKVSFEPYWMVLSRRTYITFAQCTWNALIKKFNLCQAFTKLEKLFRRNLVTFFYIHDKKVSIEMNNWFKVKNSQLFYTEKFVRW